MPVTLELSVHENDREWKLFLVEYTTADGVFGTYIYALSFEHASYILEELRATAKVVGLIESVSSG